MIQNLSPISPLQIIMFRIHPYGRRSPRYAGSVLKQGYVWLHISVDHRYPIQLVLQFCLTPIVQLTLGLALEDGPFASTNW